MVAVSVRFLFWGLDHSERSMCKHTENNNSQNNTNPIEFHTHLNRINTQCLCTCIQTRKHLWLLMQQYKQAQCPHVPEIESTSKYNHIYLITLFKYIWIHQTFCVPLSLTTNSHCYVFLNHVVHERLLLHILLKCGYMPSSTVYDSNNVLLRDISRDTSATAVTTAYNLAVFI